MLLPHKCVGVCLLFLIVVVTVSCSRSVDINRKRQQETRHDVELLADALAVLARIDGTQAFGLEKQSCREMFGIDLFHYLVLLPRQRDWCPVVDPACFRQRTNTFVDPWGHGYCARVRIDATNPMSFAIAVWSTGENGVTDSGGNRDDISSVRYVSAYSR